MTKVSLLVCSLSLSLIGCGTTVSNPTQAAAPSAPTTGVAAPIADRQTVTNTDRASADQSTPTIASAAVTDPATDLPIDSAGNYIKPPRRIPIQKRWQVVDTDPDGLNCRMPKRFQGKYFDSSAGDRLMVLEALFPDQSAAPDIASWDVMTKIPPGKIISAYWGNTNMIILKDAQDNTWLPVLVAPDDRPISSEHRGMSCVVRANTKFIRPIAP